MGRGASVAADAASEAEAEAGKTETECAEERQRSVLAALAFGRLALERPRLPARRPVQVLVAEPEADLALRRRHRVARVHQVPAAVARFASVACMSAKACLVRVLYS